MRTELVTRSFELAAERCEDLTPLVYARLFRDHPDLEPMFVLDRTGAARGNMLAQVVAALLDSIEHGGYGENMIRAEAQNHAGMGVSPDQFASFFKVVAATLQDLLGPDWTADMSGAWSSLLAELDLIVAPAT